MALLSDSGPKSWHPATPVIREACRNAALYCQSKRVNISELALHYAVSQNAVDLTVVGMDTEAVVDSNLEIVSRSLTKSEQEAMDYIIER